MSPDEKPAKDEVTINIGMPRPLHRRLSITCAVLEVSLKSALMAGASMWIDENAHAVAKALPQPRERPPGKKTRRAGDDDGDVIGTPASGEAPANETDPVDEARASSAQRRAGGGTRE
jgi:hypothetical protein